MKLFLATQISILPTNVITHALRTRLVNALRSSRRIEITAYESGLFSQLSTKAAKKLLSSLSNDEVYDAVGKLLLRKVQRNNSSNAKQRKKSTRRKQFISYSKEKSELIATLDLLA
jgi:predicted nucleotide-binding protein